MSERELLHTDRVLVVEGKYDAARFSLPWMAGT